MDQDFKSFANRLRKMDRHHGKWARRKGLSCFRVYDADVPGFPFAIDRYGDYLHAAEYRRRSTPEGAAYESWISICINAMSDALAVPRDRIFLKERRRQRGADQYDRMDDAHCEIEVEEYGLRFIVNLSDYLDTGLFLDHRQTRRMIREEASGRTFLNLFAYTGSFTVYAAAGQASRTTTIDLSNTYLNWAQRNMALNGLMGPQHQFIQADITQWLDASPHEQYDLIVLDPPTFSNSKRMDEVLDIQRDHPFLINACLKRLAPYGFLYFSTNFRKFQLEADALEKARWIEITGKTIPADFARRPPHRCWILGRNKEA